MLFQFMKTLFHELLNIRTENRLITCFASKRNQTFK